MRVLTYKDNVLTVISEDKYFSDKFEKPIFVNEIFIYEPELKYKDNMIPLDIMEISQAEHYIDSFVFEIDKEVFCVDSKGKFIGRKKLEEGETKISEPPTNSLDIYNFEKRIFEPGILINQEGIILNTFIKQTEEIVPVGNFDPTIPIYLQKFNKEENKFEIDIELLKTETFFNLRESFQNDILSLVRYIGFEEFTSYLTQEQEALDYKLYGKETIFIDTLLESRNLNENKEEFIEKILEKAKEYKIAYAKRLGEFQRKRKLLEKSETIEEIKALK